MTSLDLMDTCLYAHYRADDGRMFYIGIGKKRRPRETGHRSYWWQRVVSKHGLAVEVLQVGLSWETACELERMMIEEWRSAPDWLARLVNMTDGGEGARGELWRAANAAGKKMMAADPVWRAKMAAVAADPKWRASTEKRSANPEWRANILEAARRRSANPEWQANVLEAARRRAANPEW
jgi:hypothetical protein